MKEVTEKRIVLFPKTYEMLKEIIHKRRVEESRKVGINLSYKNSPNINHIHNIIEKVYLEEVQGV